MHPTKKKASKKGQQLLSSYFTKGAVKCTKAEQDSPARKATEPDVFIVDDSDFSEDMVPPTPLQKPSKWLNKGAVTKNREQQPSRHKTNAPLHSANAKVKTFVPSPLKLNEVMHGVSEPSIDSISTKRKLNPFDAPSSPKKKSRVLDIENYSSIKMRKRPDDFVSQSPNFTSIKEKENNPSDTQSKRDIRPGSTPVDTFPNIMQEGRRDNQPKVTCHGTHKEDDGQVAAARQRDDYAVQLNRNSTSPNMEASIAMNRNLTTAKTVEDVYADILDSEGVADCAPNDSIEIDLGDLNWDDESFETGEDSSSLYPVRRSVRAVVIGCGSGATGCLSLNVRTVDHPEEELVCNLSGSWRSLQVAVGDVVQVHAEFRGRTCVVDDVGGFVVTHPDYLISTTTVVGSMFCARKSVLSLKYKDIEGPNKEMLMGSIAHELFQLAIQEKATEDSMRAMLDRLLQRNDILHEMYGLKLPGDDVREYGEKLIPNVARWLSDYVVPQRTSKFRSRKDVSVTAVRDIEENYWCPRLGLKGKVDATTEVTIHGPSGSAEKKLIPLELKTGKHSFSFEHMGQVILYSLMMSERFDEDTSEGLLLYIRDGVDMKRVPSKHTDCCGLLQRRNDLAYHLAKQRCLEVDLKNGTVCAPQDILPPPINSDRYCPRCPLSTVCSIYQNTATNDTVEATKELPSFAKESIQHLSPSHLNYFNTWCSLLDLELLHSTARNQDRFWLEDAPKREENGLCLSGLRMIDTRNISPLCGDGRQATFHHCFRRQISATKRTTLVPTSLGIGDRVAVSDQHWTKTVAFAVGTIVDLDENEVTVKLDRNVFTYPNWQKATFRIDRLHSSAVFAICFSNLALLMSNDEKSEKLRSFVIDGVPPTFKKTLPKQWIVTCHKALKPLNDVQRRAIVKFLLADDYLLIKGMPGTGKTTTIAALIEALVLLGQTVLLASYTHSAVDNILLKLANKGVPFVRLGAQNRIHDRITEFSADFQTRMLKTTKALEEFYSNQPIIATTCLGLSHPAIYRRGLFDVCIIDEASQAMQPSCLGPLYRARRFVLVGDPQQLPPVIQSQDARKLGMDTSLFERMQTNHNTVTLSVQYRMNSEIMHLCNSLTYEGKLQCSSQKVRNATVLLPEVNNFSELLPPDSWVMQAASRELSQSVIFVCTDTTDAAEDANMTGSTSNKVEALIVSQLLHVFTKSGMGTTEIGVITPFRKQVQLLKDLLCSYRGVDISTVDQYQGREKTAILFSCVKSHEKEVSDTEILNDRRRLNVAISRARHKLVLIGNRSTVQKYQPFKELLNCLRPDQFIFLKPGDENIYREIIYAV
ncbi:DNA replication ATP-dependent helicase/nuclease DNA2-like [Ornithodoros turicata]|uniref:DNA replication ATP-dependent helicase/nuclease DNA2-like n=1 Tax=Ornithodoros turicata TaxID=34597 RepID=UPI003138EC83